jgi:hypothetical protein
MLPVLYRGPGQPATNVGACCVYYKVAVSAPVRNEKGDVTDDRGSWLISVFFTLFEIMFPTLVEVTRKARNQQVAGPMRAVLAAYPGIKFVVRDAQASVAVMNDILTTEQVPTITPAVFTEVRERIGVLPGPVNARSAASISLDGLDETRMPDFVNVVRLAQEFFDFTDPHIAAAAAAAGFVAK